MTSRPASSPHTGARPLALGLGAAALVLAACGLAAGSDGWSWAWRDEWDLVAAVRAPRTLGALLVGALLGLAGAIAQGLFRNPLADPFLLGSAAGAGLGVMVVLAAATGLVATLPASLAAGVLQAGIVGGAFAGALFGVGLALALAGGAGRPLVLLLAGVVVGVLLGALADLLALLAPATLRARQAFLLGTTAFLGWDGVAWLAAVGALVLPLAVRFARALDALVLGEASAASLGVPLARVRLLLVAAMALATGTAVAHAGLVAFVGLVAPHLVRRAVTVTHAALLALSALAGGVLLLAADVAARSVRVPQELPVGLLTAVFGGAYLLVLLRRRHGGGGAR
ncbi:iron ABC transporter permease [Calidifontimicrobium sp. SYSU G02091]|uniref:FecCD family ABC transporter permease n=1 Tax=Calidifontimicrobium sp. SYSU G02091 TaxID=2926421 RepID=UPI001F52E5F9|nr:iron chelate uptake ABC transporter family permease subunit [Calidifontimicrobium sp. SYSU G02091]MCI1193364.1 iron ABC transporter permease [Calidifontimicrobium sp. SYSU G02091]